MKNKIMQIGSLAGLVIALFATTSMAQPVASQIYNIVSVGSGKVLEIRVPSQNNGAAIEQRGEAGGVRRQQWQFELTGDGFYQIRSVGTRKCLDVRGASVDNGAIIQQWDCVGVDNQKWKLDFFVNGFVIISKSSGKVIDVSEFSLKDGANIHQWERHNGTNQRWRLERICAFESGVIIN